MPLNDIDSLTQLAFSMSENKGVYAVLLGSGISRSANILTGWEITLDLIRRIAAAEKVKNEPDWAKWFSKKTGERPQYSKLLEQLGSTAAERRAILHSYIEPSEEDRDAGRRLPTKAHSAIADLVASGHIRVIVTTNFDRLIETALRERGIEPTIVSSVDGLNGAEPLTHSRCYVFKIHGDYKDARILNTDGELSSYPAKFNSLLDRIFDEHGLIICGWSGEWDAALRQALIRAPNRRYQSYWASRSDPKGDAIDLVQRRGAKAIKIADANSFFCALRDHVETLEKARRVNPRSVELSVASAKRFLAKPEFRIELDDLVSQETEFLLRLTKDEDFSVRDGWSDEEFRARVARYEAATETLACVAGVLGRWGDGSELFAIGDLAKSLYSKAASIRSGTTICLSLRSYPPLLIITAYCLGLIRSQRWHDLHRILRLEISREERKPISFARALTPDSWQGSDTKVWQRLEGLENHKTPLSDHLMTLFTKWGRGFVGLTEDFELLFDRFEILASLAYVENQHTLAELQQAKIDGPRQQFAFAPDGRFGWRQEGYEIISQEMQGSETRAKLLGAGFANGSPEYLTLFIENLAYIVQRMRF